jgi:plasmid stability protein
MDVLVRDLDEDTVKELEEQAKESNRSFEAHLKAILDARADYRRRSRSFDSTDLIHQMRNGCEWCGE